MVGTDRGDVESGVGYGRGGGCIHSARGSAGAGGGSVSADWSLDAGAGMADAKDVSRVPRVRGINDCDGPALRDGDCEHVPAASFGGLHAAVLSALCEAETNTVEI